MHSELTFQLPYYVTLRETDGEWLVDGHDTCTLHSDYMDALEDWMRTVTTHMLVTDAMIDVVTNAIAWRSLQVDALPGVQFAYQDGAYTWSYNGEVRTLKTGWWVLAIIAGLATVTEFAEFAVSPQGK